jgi:hypothetical protein
VCFGGDMAASKHQSELDGVTVSAPKLVGGEIIYEASCTAEVVVVNKIAYFARQLEKTRHGGVGRFNGLPTIRFGGCSGG